MREALHIYRLVPNAPRDDPNWLNSLMQGEVVMRAVSSQSRRKGISRILRRSQPRGFPPLEAPPS